MNWTRFGLHRRPFPATPDASCYYPATSHEQALACLRHAFDEQAGIALLTGEAGTGKTLLCHCLLQRWPADLTTAFLTNSHGDGCKDLLQAIAFDLSLPYEGCTEQEVRLRVTDFVLTSFSQGQRTLLIVDEAQNLSAESLEELRLLSNLEAGTEKALQVLLVAQPALLTALRQPDWLALHQRITVRAPVYPLGMDESIDYLLHHIRIAGGRPDSLFTEEALELLARGTQGLPRLLNQLAHQALVVGDSSQAEQIDAEIVLEVLDQLQQECSTAAELSNEDLEADSVLSQEEDLAAGSLPICLADTEDDLPALGADEHVLAYRFYDPPRRPA